MDPITAALDELVQAVTTELRDPATRVVLLSASAEDAPLLARTLRAAEWDSENRSPWLIFDLACTDAAEALPALTEGVARHYDLLRSGLAEEGVEVPPFPPPPAPGTALDAALAHALGAFLAGTSPPLAPPVFCWLPSNSAGDAVWTDVALAVLRLLWNTPLKAVLLAPPDGTLLARLDRSAAPVRVVPFAVDQAATQDHFAALLGPPSAGRGPGALPGAAAPDVAPPPRLKPGPEPAATRAELERAGIAGILSPEEGERLRALAIEAAVAAGKGNGELALARQAEACSLCERAGARVELALMSMLAAAYQQQFGRPDEAVASYQVAERVAGEAGAYPQLAQARMGLGYLLVARERLPDAVAVYEQAVLAALLAQAGLLAFEALRLLGICHQRLSRAADTAFCWETAVRHARRFSADELRVTAFGDVATGLIDLYRQLGRPADAARVSALVEEIGTRAAGVSA